MIHDPGTNDLIRWSDVHDDTVYVHDVAAFSEKVLPHYFAHSNWPSFVRQLNSKCVFIYVIIMIDSIHVQSYCSIWISSCQG